MNTHVTSFVGIPLNGIWGGGGGVTYSEPSDTTWQLQSLVERNKYMYNNSATSDIRFTFGNNHSEEVFYAHKYLLAVSSPVFNELLFSEPGKTITHIYLPDCDNETITDFFSFLYKGKCPLARSVEERLGILRLVMQYQVTLFDKNCKKYLEPTALDAFKYLEQFLALKADRQVKACFDYIDTLANEYFTSDYFLNIKLTTLDSLLRRDSLGYSEVKLFKAVINWVDHKCVQQDLELSYENRRKILGNVIYNIRFLAMTLDEFITNVMAVDILNDHESIGIIKTITGHHVTDLKWDNFHVRRQSTSMDWWKYSGVSLFLSVFIIYCLFKNSTIQKYTK